MDSEIKSDSGNHGTMGRRRKERPQDKWNRENGLVSKSYKLSKETADKFDEACEKLGESKKSHLEAFMEDFAAKVASGEIKPKGEK